MREKKWRFLDLYVDSYADATMCISPAIAQAKSERAVPNSLAIYTHRKASLVMGRQNDPDVDIDYQFCKKNSIIVKRVPTPGTIYGHTGYLMSALYLDKTLVPPNIPDIFATINNNLSLTFNRVWGVNCRHRPINDLEIEIEGVWKKVGPFSISFFGDSICIRLGLTISSFPLEIAEKAITPPHEKFIDKAAQSISQRIGFLEDALGRKVALTEVKEVISKAMEDLFEVEFALGQLTEKEIGYDQEFIKKYDNDDWFFANTVRKRFGPIPEDVGFGEFVQKIPNGPLIRARVLRKEDKILDVSFTGWFQGLNLLDGAERIEEALKNSPFDEREILKRLHDVYRKLNLQIGNAFPKDFQFTLMEAGKRAQKR
jgi:lipoate-protein ligase A